MDVLEAHTHSFIIRLWVEGADLENDEAVWRGHITHVASGERRYVQDLREISAFIEVYLKGMGIRPSKRRRLQQWVNRHFFRRPP